MITQPPKTSYLVLARKIIWLAENEVGRRLSDEERVALLLGCADWPNVRGYPALQKTFTTFVVEALRGEP